MSNCTELDHTREAVLRWEGVAISTAVALALLGLALLVYGERLVRPTGAAFGGGATFVVAYSTLGYAPDLACDARIGVAAVLAALAALVIACMFRLGIFLVGAAGLGGVAHLVYTALPSTLTRHGSLNVAGRSEYYYIVLLVSGVGGGILSCTQRARLLRLLSSAVGGGCIVLSAHLLTLRALGIALPSRVALPILLGVTATGTLLQSLRCRRRTEPPRFHD